MTDSHNSAPKPETQNENPFAKIADALQVTARLFPDYYKADAQRQVGAAMEHTGVSEITQLLAELDEAKNALESRQLIDRIKITLFSGIQARNSEKKSHNEGHKIIENFYESLSSIMGTGMVDYHDLEEQAVALKAERRFMVDGSKFRFRVREWPQLAITNENEELRGLQMRLADNIFANFYLPNFGQPSEVVADKSRVEIYVVPGSAATAI
jgi:hypothetical protein